MAARGSEVALRPATANGEVSSEVVADGQVQVSEGNRVETQQPQQQQPQQQQPPNAWQVIKGVLFRIFIIWLISSWFRRGSAPPEQSDPTGVARQPSHNLFPKDTLMDLRVYISENEHFTEFNDSAPLFWEHFDLVYGDWTSGESGTGCYEHYGEIETTEHMKSNGSMYIHIYFTKSGYHPDPMRKAQYRRLATVSTTRMLNKYKRRKFQKTKNLLTGQTDADPEIIKRAEDYGPVEIISHWHPNLTVHIVDDHTAWSMGAVPPPLDQYVKFDPVSGDYYPIIYFNDYWNLQKDYFPINASLEKLPLRMTYCPLSLWKWQLYAAQSTKSPWNFWGEDLYDQPDEEQDSVKVALLETNPYLLAVTIIVSIVHSVFEFLAFKNDIQFWNSRQSLEGLSVRSVIFGVFQSGVVLLYILDNETNFVVQVSVFIGLLIDLWKITKVMDVRIDRDNKVAGIFPRLTLKDKSTYVQSSTKNYDDMAFKYLSWILFPLLGCYAVYSLLYMEHKSWYSWVLSMLYGFLLTFGFITMTPQLFINYKLKSVAHLPWRMLTYKALNTFIDDLFAFVIKMPMMYRIGCLRDDVVFFIYLYQRWIYRVDPTRMNEFGTSGEDSVKASKENSSPEALMAKPEEEKKND
ncbi:cleft lip and palate transmembrane protein 1 homolog isoform X2 [Chiloscyllium plagiosum]|uniref:cleft lip and palate transmembrane protein 1 homolog isoform X2 n=1 Tax=Chiloscyllium plagiosum TaxID=36176 RepID=UPI001CB80565|nr:cleft lip and palate transmembrane protein 1 homolog isoform X2 [Chiloscyllium plagiosum]